MTHRHPTKRKQPSPCHLLTWLMIASVILSLPSCRGNEDDPGNGRKKEIRLSISLSPCATRSMDENRIGDVIICAYKPDGTYLQTVYDGNGTENHTDIAADLNIDESLSEIQLLAFANWSSYGVGHTDFKGMDKQEALNGVSSLTFTRDVDMIPMIGEQRVRFSGLEHSQSISIAMTRVLAKIELIDNIEGDLSIQSAEIQGHTFTKGADNRFYVYLPEMTFAGDDDPKRVILLTLSDNSTREVLIRKADSTDLKTGATDWDSLVRNNVYRLNITATDAEPEPIEIQETLRICWYTTRAGKFNSMNYYIYLINSPEEYNNIINPYSSESKKLNIADYPNLDFKAVDDQFNYIDIESSSFPDFTTLNYVISSDISYNPTYHRLSMRNISKDSRLENFGSITYCWLNGKPAQCHNSPDKYLTSIPANQKCRLYWIGNGDKLNNSIVKATNPKNSYLTVYPAKFNENRGLYFIDFMTNTDVSTAHYTLYGVSNGSNYSEYSNKSFGVIDMTVERIDGEDYFVFYVN